MPSGLTSGATRYEKWRLRMALDGTDTPQGSTKIMTRLMANPDLPARVQSVFTSLYNMEDSVRQVLNTAGVSTILVAMYLNFGRQMWKLTQRFSGETAALAAQGYIALWVARGLNQTILEQIRTDVFGVAAPVGP
jgi:hypothetical protein